MKPPVEPKPTKDQAEQSVASLAEKLRKAADVDAEYYVTLDQNARGEGKPGFVGYVVIPAESVKRIVKALES